LHKIFEEKEKGVNLNTSKIKKRFSSERQNSASLMKEKNNNKLKKLS